MPSYNQIKAKYEAHLQDKVNLIGQIIEEDDNLSQLNIEFSKFNRYKNLVEECYLKQKLVFKRALQLCKALLKQCGGQDVQDQNVVSMCESLIQPAITSQDQELNLLAIECIGLIAILDK
jgi:hypothetical protein